MGLNDIMKIGNIIKQLRKEKGLTQKAMANLLHIPYSTYSNYENNNRTPDETTLNHIATALDVNMWELLGIDKNMAKHIDKIEYTESGEALVSTALDKSSMSAIFLMELLNENGKRKALEQIDLLSRIPEYQKEPTSAPESKIIVLPYFRAGVSAGSGIFIFGNEAEDEIELPDLPEYEAADFAIDVNGDSMEPDFSHDDIALVQQDAELFPGDIGVFVVNSNAFIKELGRNELISRNKDYKNIPIHEGDNVVCMGKVIGKVKTDEE